MEGTDTVKMTTLEGMVEDNTVNLRVANGTPAKSLATSVLRYMDEGKRVVLSCIGAHASHQAAKAVAIANGEAGQQGFYIYCVFAFDSKGVVDRDTGKEVELTAVRFLLGKMPTVLR